MTATVIDVVAELEIPDQGMTSRVLYRDDRLRVVGFGFAAGGELTEHSAPVPVVIQVVRGRLRLTLGEETTELGNGGWVHLPARLPHSVHALEPTLMLLTLHAAAGGER